MSRVGRRYRLSREGIRREKEEGEEKTKRVRIARRRYLLDSFRSLLVLQGEMRPVRLLLSRLLLSVLLLPGDDDLRGRVRGGMVGQEVADDPDAKEEEEEGDEGSSAWEGSGIIDRALSSVLLLSPCVLSLSELRSQNLLSPLLLSSTLLLDHNHFLSSFLSNPPSPLSLSPLRSVHRNRPS